MEALVNSLKAVLADAYIYYFKAHSFHWNVEGPNFPQYHKLFGKVYTQLFEEIDLIGEHMRALAQYAPSSIAELIAPTTITEEIAPSDAITMVRKLSLTNDMFLITLMRAYQLAEDANELGLSNFLQDLIEKHQKTGWMLKATAK